MLDELLEAIGPHAEAFGIEEEKKEFYEFRSEHEKGEK